MRPLSETVIFEPVDRLMGVRSTLSDPKLLSMYGIRFDLYDYIVQSFKGFKYPIAKFVYQNAIGKKIAPILLAESADKATPAITDFPTSIPCFQLGGVAYADISPRASYVRDGVTKQPNHLKIQDRELYAFLQSALVLRTFNLNAQRIESNIKFMKCIAEVYAIFLSKAIDKNYPVSSEQTHFAALQFLCALFFFEYVIKMSPDKARQMASSLRLTDTSACVEVLGNLEYLGSVGTMELFFKMLGDKFTYLRSESFKYHNVVLLYTKMYGQNAVFAIENLFSFVNMILMASMRIGMYNDQMIDKIAGKYVDDVEKMLAEVLSTLHE